MQQEIKRFKKNSSECQFESLNEKFQLKIDDSNYTPDSSMLTALDNHLILQDIFKFLSPGDLRVCCEVNEKWRDIAGPMIFEYHLQVDRLYGMKVMITKGYLNPQIEQRSFPPELETVYLETLKYRNCFISLEFRGYPWTIEDHEKDSYGTVDFVRKFAHLVYKLGCWNYNKLHKFFCEPPSTQDLQLLPYFPNCEEYSLSKQRSLDWFSDVEISSHVEHLRRINLGSIGPFLKPRNFLLKTPTFLQMIPNLQEIHGVPFTMISHFVTVSKLHLIRSVRFHGVDDVNLEMEAMKTMVQLGIKFKFLRIGRNNTSWTAREEFIERNKRHFEDLLEIGKDTLEHLELHFERHEDFIKFPITMSALTSITLKVQYSHGPVYFPVDFNFSQCFPKLMAISFPTMPLAEWKKGGSWWGSKGRSDWDEFRKGIRHLSSHPSLCLSIQKKLLRRFPGVDHIDFVNKFDLAGVDGIISD